MPSFGPRGQKSNADINGLTSELTYDLPDIGTVTHLGNHRHVMEDITLALQEFEWGLLCVVLHTHVASMVARGGGLRLPHRESTP